MLSRYTIVRGAPASSLPDGVRQDTRKHTQHPLRPTPELVELALKDHDWDAYRAGYRALLEQRFAEARAPFDHLARMTEFHDVYLGCNCPTQKQPDVSRCHTMLALAFMKEKYPSIVISEGHGRDTR
jgi:hypothetical protein